MPRCPYPDHDTPVELPLRTAGFACCDTCYQVSFLCSADCETLNRTLAQYCRKCGASVAPAKAEAQWRESLTLDRSGRERKSTYRLNLSSFRARTVRVLCSYRGYLCIGTQGAGLLITNAMRPEPEAILQRFVQEEDVLAIVPVETGERPLLLVTTGQAVYRLHLLPSWELVEVHRTRQRFIGTALATAYGTLIFEADATAQGASLLQRNPDSTEHRVSLPMRPEVVRVVALAQDHVLIFNTSEAVIYDSQAHAVIWQGTSPYPLDMTVAPAYHAGQQQVYLGGQQALLRLALDGEQPIFFRVGEQTFRGFQFSVSADGQELFIAHDGGVHILNSLTGGTNWASAPVLGIRSPSGVFLPCQVGRYLCFVTLNHGQHDACFLPLHTRDDHIRVGEFNQILCPPAIGPGTLLLAVSQGNQIEVQALQL